jgi:hypothetical protein
MGAFEPAHRSQSTGSTFPSAKFIASFKASPDLLHQIDRTCRHGGIRVFLSVGNADCGRQIEMTAVIRAVAAVRMTVWRICFLRHKNPVRIPGAWPIS